MAAKTTVGPSSRCFGDAILAPRKETRLRIIDITAPLGPDAAVYPGDPPVELTPLSRADGADGFALSRLVMGTHAGTHIDPPAHFIPGGATVDLLPLDALIGPARLVDLAYGRPVEASDIPQLPPAERLLLRTGGMPLTEAAARTLVERGVKLVGVDGLSVAPEDAPGPVHRILLTTGIIILEGLALAGVPEGAYTLICLPLRLTAGDGAPARAILLHDDIGVRD